jgi:hypothetical protein
MSSSTSSSRQELKVIIFVLAVLLGVEIAIRGLGASVSADFRYLQNIPNRAETMSKSEDFRILVIGNSLTNCGFNSQTFKMEMDLMGAGPLHVEIVALDGAGVCEWSWLLKHYFWNNNHHPDMIVVNSGEKWQDEKNPRLHRLPFYINNTDIPVLFREDITEFGRQMEFLQSYALRSYSGKTRVRYRVLNAIVPYYKAGIQEGNDVAKLPERTNSKPKTPKLTYRQITRLVNGASQRQIPVIFVNMPKEHPYDLPPNFPETARSIGAKVVDCQDASSMLQGRFVDGHHMDESGASIFGRELARRLWNRFPHLFERRRPDTGPGER